VLKGEGKTISEKKEGKGKNQPMYMLFGATKKKGEKEKGSQGSLPRQERGKTRRKEKKKEKLAAHRVLQEKKKRRERT